MVLALPLPALGWDPSWDGARADADPSLSLRPARVTLQGRDAWRVHDGADEIVVGVRGRLRSSSSLSGYLAKLWSYSVCGALVHMKFARSTTSPITCRCDGSCRLSI